jgi:hypothetical protein
VFVFENRNPVCVKKASALAGIREAQYTAGTAEISHETASQEALQVQCDIRAQFLQAATPGKETKHAERASKIRPWKRVRRRERRIAFEQWFPSWVDDPCDARLWPSTVNG